MIGLSTAAKFRTVSVTDLLAAPVPPSTNTYQPVQHAWLYDEVRKNVEKRGYIIAGSDLRLTDSGDEFFGILKLRTDGQGNSPWDLSLGIRNTNNKRASVGVFLGTNVWVCDNLQFSAEHTFLRKHHAGTYDVLRSGIENTCRELHSYRQEQSQFVGDLQRWLITPKTRDHLLVNLLQRGGVKANDLLPILKECRSHSFGNPECEDRTAWGLYNAVTYVGKSGFQRNPETAAVRSLAINKVFQVA